MSVLTHCKPTGSLGTAELPVPNISPATVLTLIPSGGVGIGNIRGVVVHLHGLELNTTAIPPPLVDSPGGFLPTFLRTFCNDLVTDGWVVLVPIYQEDTHVVSPVAGLYNDIQADGTHGLRYRASSLHWIDHVVNYVQTQFGNWPIVPFGFSEGGWRTLLWAASKPSTIVAYGCHCPWTIGSTLSPAFTPGHNFSLLATNGFDLSTMNLNAVSIPGVVGYGTADNAVGWNSAGTGGTPISNTDAMITNATAAGQPITRNQTTDGHAFTGTTGTADTTFYLNWFASHVDPLCPRTF